MFSNLLIRIFFIFGLAAAAAAAGLGLWYRHELGLAVLPGSPAAAGQELIAEFSKTHAPIVTLPGALEEVTGGSRELIEPLTTLPQTFAFERATMRRLVQYQEHCGEQDLTSAADHVATDLAVVRNAALAKAWRWAQYLCGAAGEPPDTFFSRPPFMHPNGRSYVTLAVSTHSTRFAQPAWQESMHRFAHVLEDFGTTDPQRGELRRLGRAALATMLRGETAILTKDRFVALRRKDEGSASFEVFPRTAWDEATRTARVGLVAQSDTKLCAPGRDFCWTSIFTGALRQTTPIVIGALVALALSVLGFAASGALRWWMVKKLEYERTKMVRLLAHELRTPATSLALTVDALRGSFETLPEAAQEAFLRISSDAERLKRVVATSARFLRQKQANKVERLATEQPLASLADFLNAVIEPLEQRHGAKVDRLLPDGDFGVQIDPAWLELALSNLVDNALRHGRAPVSVEARTEGGGFALVVRDAGNFNGATRDAEPTGSGLGFGLIVVKDAARALGASIQKQTNPTRFTLVFKRGRREAR